MSTATQVAWVLGVLFVLACALLILALGCAEDYRGAMLRERALRVAHGNTIARLAHRCGSTDEDRRVCDLVAGHTGLHERHHAGLLAAEWSGS